MTISWNIDLEIISNTNVVSNSTSIQIIKPMIANKLPVCNLLIQLHSSSKFP
jgi:hypothetical protein